MDVGMCCGGLKEVCIRFLTVATDLVWMDVLARGSRPKTISPCRKCGNQLKATDKCEEEHGVDGGGSRWVHSSPNLPITVGCGLITRQGHLG